MKLYVRGYKKLGACSWLIRKFTFGTIAHTSLVFDLDDGKYIEIEALQGKGVISHLPRNPKEFDFIEYAIPVDDERVLECYVDSKATVGHKYDLKGIWGFVVRKDKHNPEKWFCSEHVAYRLLKIRYAISRRPPYKETPTSVCESYRLIAPTPEVGGA